MCVFGHDRIIIKNKQTSLNILWQFNQPAIQLAKPDNGQQTDQIFEEAVANKLKKNQRNAPFFPQQLTGECDISSN